MLDEAGRQASTREVLQLGVRTVDGDPLGLTPLQPGHRGQLFNGRRVDVDLPRRPLLTRSVEAQEPKQELPGIRRALAPSSEMPPWRPGFPRAPRIPTATASSLLAPL